MGNNRMGANMGRQRKQLTTDGYKLCCTCHLEKPIEQFRRRHKDREDTRHSSCDECNLEAVRKHNAKKRSSALKLAVCKIAEARRLSEADALVTALVRRLGGWEVTRQAWAEHIKAAAARRPGCRTVLSSFKAIFRVAQLAEAKRLPPKAPEDVTDEEINAEIREIVGQELDRKAEQATVKNENSTVQ